jgi:hypothetical protein
VERKEERKTGRKMKLFRDVAAGSCIADRHAPSGICGESQVDVLEAAVLRQRVLGAGSVESDMEES